MIWCVTYVTFNTQQSTRRFHYIGGKNGSGKSVTLKMLANIMKPSSGLLSVKGNISYAPDHTIH
jgi:ABC-type polysaccharide/polyol phosphate transport system ATPase subunit